MDYYKSVLNFFNGATQSKPEGMEYYTVNNFNSLNLPYSDYLLPSNSLNRQGVPSAGKFEANSPQRMGQVVQPLNLIAQQNTQTSRTLGDYFFTNANYPIGTPEKVVYTDNLSDTSLQAERSTSNYGISLNKVYTNANNQIMHTTGNENIDNYYVLLASDALHVNADPLTRLFFSDDNINHLRNTAVQKIKQITADSGVAGDKEGVTIKTPNMDDFFNYMLGIFKNYKIQNGSICFVALKNPSDLKSDIAKLNTNVLQEYVSKMVSQINMYIYYYRDASQLPEQLSRPTYTAMKGSKSLEYNTGFTPGNSIGIASYNQVGNI